jgi:hypothetical protein
MISLRQSSASIVGCARGVAISHSLHIRDTFLQSKTLSASAEDSLLVHEILRDRRQAFDEEETSVCVCE